VPKFRQNKPTGKAPARPAKTDANDLEPRLVGGEIRDLRKARRMTIQAMAAATELSVGHLSEIERGIASPSLDALHAIAAALGVTIGWFLHNVEAPNAEERPFIVRAGRRRKLHFATGITDELLSPHLRGALELVLSHFEPGAVVEKSYSHHGEEAGFVLSGALELWIENRKFALKEGDSFSFESVRPHRYRNPGKVPATVIWAITPPSY
jgi:transcriptional regulator with XRE-family HTH domain